MSQQHQATQSKVRVNELRPGMVIREVTELSFDYSVLDPKTITFLQESLRGASALLLKNASPQKVAIAQLKPFDHLLAILDIPESTAIFKVDHQSASALEKQGFLEFVVEPDRRGPVAAPAVITEAEKAASRKRVAEARQMMEKVEVAESQRDNSRDVVEEMFDQGRSGKFTTKSVETMVGNLLSEGSVSAMKAITGLKGSDQTYAHCVDMAVIMEDCYADILAMMGKPFTEELKRFVLIAGFMHDIGKSEVPKEILESTTRFEPDSREMMIMRNHTVYGARILTEMGMNKTAINVAHCHHVKKDQTLFTSYPDMDYSEVSSLARLASIVDVYQALIGKRRYKKNWVPGKAVQYLLRLKDSEFDGMMLDNFIKAIGLYPVGSLVRLSTGDLAFVIRIAPHENTERPLVAVVENAKRERISHPQVIDLMLEKSLAISEIVDHYQHYGKSEDEAFQIFRSIQIA